VDIQAALREVRRTLGPDAVIMSTRETPEGIEVLASAPAREPGRAARPTPAARAPAVERVAPVARRKPRAPGLAGLAAGMARNGAPGIAHARATSELDSLGIAADVRASILDAVAGGRPELAVDAVRRDLEQRIRVEGPALMRKGGRVAVLGATGVGKTTTIAKLAAHFARRHGPGQVALVNADQYRIGASDQLRRFGHLMGVPTYEVHGRVDLREVLARLSKRKLVLVDTAGIGHQDVRFAEQLELLSGSGLECYLALSLNTQTAVLARSVEAYSTLELRGCVLTKEDEAVSLGGGLSMAARHGLAVSYVTNGPGVPADIRLADARKLIARAVALAAHAGSAPEAARAAEVSR
jgi:flagellar biosynthesis protein FlhF